MDIFKPSNLRSIAGDEKLVVYFQNDSSSETIKLYWINYEGKEIEVATIFPKDMVGQQSFLTHCFLMRSLEQPEKIVGLFVLDSSLENGCVLKSGQVHNPSLVPSTPVPPPLDKNFVKVCYEFSKKDDFPGYSTGLKSLSGFSQAPISVKNTTQHTLDAYWVDFEGKLLPYGQVQPNGTFSSLSGVNHAFVFKSSDRSYEKVVIVSQSRPLVVLEDDTISICAHTLEEPTETSCHQIIAAQISERTAHRNMGFSYPASISLVQGLASHLRMEGKRFVDEDFPPQSDWVRAYDFFHGDVAIVKKGFSATAPRQGSVGNCWLIQSLSGAAIRPKEIQNVFCLCESVDPSLGLYAVTFHSEEPGKKYTVLLDDYCPMHSDFVYAKSYAAKGELWIPLIEKAFAKMVGGYIDLAPSKHSFNPAHVLVALLGGKAKHFEWFSGENSEGRRLMNENKFWPLIERLLDSEKSVPVCTSKAVNGGDGAVDSLGIVHYHGYSILEYRKFSQHNLNLIKIRNTWANTEWGGSFGDNSKEWQKYPQLSKELNHEAKDDGCFWMTYDDFIKNYCVIWWNEHE
ncbi:hypothetical protein C9374_010385 [Naegleria lovaniensis]|uniref:Calpain catalytic domain-containing protein n=1 Tax=Naegleria lovaniensis TaxID=51637 RepID=A0AA88GEE3_NAELO|nr:uncharacterized protein C9374_010385 [Naegleria lovaniensis]KAG2375011.1 hypothetical protein C9374_010385 [Naegleria lovaniensis]